MSRGNRRSAIFTTDDDRRCFMNTLAEVALAYHVRVYAACLMVTHYHIVLNTPRGNLSAMMRQLNGEDSKTAIVGTSAPDTPSKRDFTRLWSNASAIFAASRAMWC